MIELTKIEANLLRRRVIIDGCWIVGGYQSKRYIVQMNGIRTTASRFMAYLHLDLDLGSPLLVCHKLHCENIGCFNPDHLYLGTDKDNMKDKSTLGHHPSQKKTTCKFGHPLEGKQKDSKTGLRYRSCLICKKLTNAKRSKKYRDGL